MKYYVHCLFYYCSAIPPPVSWAQREDLLYVVIDVECKDIEHRLVDNSSSNESTTICFAISIILLFV